MAVGHIQLRLAREKSPCSTLKFRLYTLVELQKLACRSSVGCTDWGHRIVGIAQSVSSISNLALRGKERMAEMVRRLGPGKTVQISQGVIVPAQFAVNAVKASGAAVAARLYGTHPLSKPSADIPLYISTERTMFADFAAHGRSRLKSRELHWSAPVKLAAVQPSPRLRSGSYFPTHTTKESQKTNEPTPPPTKAREQADPRNKQQEARAEAAARQERHGSASKILSKSNP